MASLISVQDTAGTSPNWDWKESQVERLKNGDSVDYFSQGSVTPDTMILYAGPPRIDAKGFSEKMSPIGLVTDVSFNIDNQLRPIWEIGTNQTYFTRGKSTHSLQIGAMVANKPSLMKLMSRQTPSPDGALNAQTTGSTSGHFPRPYQQSGQFWANLDSDATASPFGIMIIFKTKGSSTDADLKGDHVGAVYLENCNMGNFSFAMNSSAVSLQENVSIMFDRVLAVDYEG